MSLDTVTALQLSRSVLYCDHSELESFQVWGGCEKNDVVSYSCRMVGNIEESYYFSFSFDEKFCSSFPASAA